MKIPGSILILLVSVPLWAQDPTFPKVHRPYFLQAKDKIPNDALSAPSLSLIGPKGETLDMEVNIDAPPTIALDQFSDPFVFEQVKGEKKTESTPGHFYWHSAGEQTYCHLLDQEGNHWYGWIDDGKFDWILWRGHRYWWKDPFAGLWLYYFQGSWWRADGQASNSIQVCVDGEYYLCDKRGKILKDMGQDGNGDIVSAPGTYQGDMHSGGHGGHHGEGRRGDGDGDHGSSASHHGEAAGAPSNGSAIAPGGNPPSAPAGN